MPRTYITNMTHFLNPSGRIPTDIPREARELASFLALIVDEVTSAFPDSDCGVDTEIRCRTENCPGHIVGALNDLDQAINWCCMECGHNGVVSNWQATRWDNTGLRTPRAIGTTQQGGEDQ